MTAPKLQILNANNFLKLVFGAVLSAGIILGLASASSLAQAADQEGTANTLKISPVRTDVTMNPGDTKIVKVTVTNPSNQRVAVRVIQNDFVAGDEEGTPAIILEETEYAESHSLKRFMTPIENVTLEPNEARAIDVELKVPADAEPGGYFGVVRFAPADPDDGGQVNASASVASLMLLTVAGDAPEKLDLTQFAVQQDGRPKTFFVNGTGIEVAARFENKGNVQAGPFGKVSVIKGDDIVFEEDFNNKDQRDMVLPSSARRWTIPLEGLESFGRYTVSATFTYGSKNQTVEATQTFWVVPMPIIIAAGVGLLVLIAAIVGLVWFLRGRRAGSQSFSSSRRM